MWFMDGQNQPCSEGIGNGQDLYYGDGKQGARCAMRESREWADRRVTKKE